MKRTIMYYLDKLLFKIFDGVCIGIGIYIVYAIIS